MNVVVTKTALKHFQKIVDYLVDKWGETVGIQFERKINRFLDLLSDFPEIGTIVNIEKKIRAFQLTKQNRIYYRIKSNIILILAIFDVRQDPNRIKYK
jgi:plasmid stabilization system protein ParE